MAPFRPAEGGLAKEVDRERRGIESGPAEEPKGLPGFPPASPVQLRTEDELLRVKGVARRSRNYNTRT
jgi:hypothetical protein